jgi:tRNA-guanine family transglycosylase
MIEECTKRQLNCRNVVASYRIADFPRAGLKFHPWSITDTKAVLINAYDFIANPRTCNIGKKWLLNKDDISEKIEFSGPIILDSGAFNFLQNENISITPEEVLQLSVDMKVDYGVVLDHPFPPNLSIEDKKLRIRTTLENTQRMVDYLSKIHLLNENFQLIPVIHGHDRETLESCLEQICRVIGKEPAILGIGSLAPLAKNGNKKIVVDSISTVRELLPNSHLHCFSMGSALLMLIAFYCGADTVDSQTWIMSAAFKQIQLPGGYLTRFSEREEEKNSKYEKTKNSFVNQVLSLINTENLKIKNWDTGECWIVESEKDIFEYLDFLTDKPGKNNIHRRACHNLYIFNFEAERIKKIVPYSSTEFESFISQRLNNTIYKKVLDYAIERNKNMKSLTAKNYS